jgi:hypothetical protein
MVGRGVVRVQLSMVKVATETVQGPVVALPVCVCLCVSRNTTIEARGCNGSGLTGKSQRVVRVTGKCGINSGGAGAAGGFDDGAHGVCV